MKIRTVVALSIVVVVAALWAPAGFSENKQDKNKLRNQKNCESCDLSNSDLNGAILKGAKASKSNFSGAGLYRADLSGGDYTDANFNGAKLQGANLNGTKLNRANFNGADLKGAKLGPLGLKGAVTTGTTTCPDGKKGPCK